MHIVAKRIKAFFANTFEITYLCNKIWHHA